MAPHISLTQEAAKREQIILKAQDRQKDLADIPLRTSDRRREENWEHMERCAR